MTTTIEIVNSSEIEKELATKKMMEEMLDALAGAAGTFMLLSGQRTSANTLINTNPAGAIEIAKEQYEIINAVIDNYMTLSNTNKI